MVEFNLQEESQQLADPSTYVFDDEIDFGNMDSGEVTTLLEGEWLPFWPLKSLLINAQTP
jgi:hypothetical protein